MAAAAQPMVSNYLLTGAQAEKLVLETITQLLINTDFVPLSLQVIRQQ